MLETGEFIRVGSSKAQKTDVRVVAATSVEMLQAVQRGSFREDLYYRLNTVPIHVPPPARPQRRTSTCCSGSSPRMPRNATGCRQ